MVNFCCLYCLSFLLFLTQSKKTTIHVHNATTTTLLKVTGTPIAQSSFPFYQPSQQQSTRLNTPSFLKYILDTIFC